MARKKSVPVKNAASTANRFRNLEGVTPSASVNSTKTVEPKPAAPVQTDAEFDDPSLYSFPFNYIYAFQDLVNDQMTYSKFIQIMCLGYVVQVFYYSSPGTWQFWEGIVMNYTGVLIAMLISYRLTSQKAEFGQGPAPSLPDFNLLFVLIIPQLLCIKNEYHVVENLTYNYFAVGSLPMFFNGFTAIFYSYIYGDIFEVRNYMKEVFVFAALKIMLDYINVGDEEHEISNEVVNQEIDYDLVDVEDGKVTSGLNTSLSKAEIHLILVGLMHLIFHLESEDIVLIILQKLVIGVIIGLMISFPIFKFHKLGGAVVFPVVFYFAVQYQLEPILGNSLVWLYDQIINNLPMFGSWLAVLTVNIFIIFNVNIEFNLRRKIWHFLVVATILPSMLINYEFTKLGLVGLFIISILVETIRLNRITVIGEFIYDKLYKFQDIKDLKGPLNLSYIYLIIGTSLPIILNTTKGLDLKQFIGVIGLGLADSIASIIGKTWGRMKYNGSNKTIEGSVGFFVSSALGFYLLSYYLSIPITHEVLFIVLFLTSLFEGTTSLNDNLVLSLFTYVSWEVLELVY